jgi:hypothetical protein
MSGVFFDKANTSATVFDVHSDFPDILPDETETKKRGIPNLL